MASIITDGAFFITINKNNTFDITNDRKSAKIFNDNTITGTMKSLPKILRKYNWRIESIEQKSNKYEFLNPDYIEIDKDELIHQLKIVGDMIAKSKGNMVHLNSRLSEQDKTQEDILHYIENFSFSASEGYKLAKQIKDLRAERRRIKNEICRVNIISNATTSSLADGKILKQLNQIDFQQYTPRVLGEMFEERTPVEI